MAGNKNAWFKHYNDASTGHTLSVLWANRDHEAIAFFWLILELVSRFEKEENRGEIVISWKTFAKETNWKPTKCRRVLSRISPISEIEMREEQNGYVTLLVPNWSKLQENRGGKRDAKNDQKPDRRKRIEERGKNREIDKEGFDFDSLILKYPNKAEIQRGAKLLRDEIQTSQDFLDFNHALDNYNRFLGLEKNKAWLRPKNFASFVNSWGEWFKPDPSVFEDSSSVTRANLEEIP